MPVIEGGTRKYTQLIVDDELYGGEPRSYRVMEVFGDPEKRRMGREFAHIEFQRGPIKTVGVNGCFCEDLLYICLHRLKRFQSGDLPSSHNDNAIHHIECALQSLKDRTYDREKRGVEGTYKA